MASRKQLATACSANLVADPRLGSGWGRSFWRYLVPCNGDPLRQTWHWTHKLCDFRPNQNNSQKTVSQKNSNTLGSLSILKVLCDRGGLWLSHFGMEIYNSATTRFLQPPYLKYQHQFDLSFLWILFAGQQSAIGMLGLHLELTTLMQLHVASSFICDRGHQCQRKLYMKILQLRQNFPRQFCSFAELGYIISQWIMPLQGIFASL